MSHADTPLPLPPVPPPTVAKPTPVNILLVDDHPGKLLTYETMLESLGENLIKANSGREALAHLLRHEITVILTDVSMPDLDGFELAEIIRDHPRFQRTAIIFVSAVHQSDFDRLKGYESGAVDYVSVPVVPELLRAKVRVFTELYRKTREAERLTLELEARVRARTAELESAIERQVELAEKLRETDRRKDEFLALLAHELRNPLAPVQNALQIMQMKTIDDAELRWCRDVMERQTIQLTRLVDDLLDVSRITHGKIVLRHETVDIATVVSNALETCRPKIDAQHHQLHVTLPQRPAQVQGDPARLTQVLANLINNAARYQDPFGVIDVIAEVEGDRVQIHVRDQGHGLTEEQCAQVFGLFTQGERPAGRSHGGLGVGLYLVRTLVDLHGGEVSVKSAGRGRGSVFTVELPTVTDAVRADTAGEQIVRLTPRRGLEIVVVDDNRDSADSMAALLTLSGFSVRTAYDGERAMALLEEQLPSVLLLDIGMPTVDGYEICRRVRARHGQALRVIAVTGFGQDRDLQRSRRAGFDAHTVKPLSMESLNILLMDRLVPNGE